MGRKDSNRRSEHPSSLPPETEPIDSGWEEPLELDFPTAGESDAQTSDAERITAIPDVPMSDLARNLMAETDSDRVPSYDQLGLPTRRPELGTPSVRESLSSPHVPRFDIDTDLGHESGPETWKRIAEEQGAHEFDPLSEAPEPDSFVPFTGIPTAPPPTDAPSTARETLEQEEELRARASLPTLDLEDPIEEAPPTPHTSYGELQLDFSELGPAAHAPPSEPVEPPPTRRPDKTGLEVQSEPPPSDAEDPLFRELRDRYAVGDFTGALVIAESILEQDPSDIEAARYAQSCRDVLTQMYSARLGSLDQVVRVAIPPEEIRWLSLDHRAGFLLSLVDGCSTMEEILDICGMPRLDALRIMFMLHEQRVVAVGS